MVETRRLAALLAVSLSLLLGGCGGLSHLLRGDVDRSSAYTVGRGDTLYSIAETYGRSYRDLATWNNIDPPYRIHPGQRLILTPPSRHYYVVSKGDTLYSLAWRYGHDHREVADWNGIRPPYRLVVGQRLRLFPPNSATASNKTAVRESVAKQRSTSTARTEPPVSKPRVESRQVKKTVRKPPVRSSTKRSTHLEKRTPRRQTGRVVWRWPASGVISAAFVPKKGQKGLDIRGKLGQAVKAAASGEVVYSGGGLRGYGNLIIIKHNDTYLSAYGHNKRLLVKEGVTVKQGEKIAEMGDSGKGGVILHFEIRRDGKPVNPLRYLPKRRN